MRTVWTTAESLKVAYIGPGKCVFGIFRICQFAFWDFGLWRFVLHLPGLTYWGFPGPWTRLRNARRGTGRLRACSAYACSHWSQLLMLFTISHLLSAHAFYAFAFLANAFYICLTLSAFFVYAYSVYVHFHKLSQVQLVFRPYLLLYADADSKWTFDCSHFFSTPFSIHFQCSFNTFPIFFQYLSNTLRWYPFNTF